MAQRRLKRFEFWIAAVLLVCGCTALRRPREQASVPRSEADDRSRNDDNGLYSASAALSDALSGRLEYIGTGRWPGVERSRACAFRNQRVVVVNAYCALNETPAFRVDIYSPQRGRVRIYAEADGPVSVRKRRDYFTFVVESSPAPESTPGTQPLTLEMNYEALRLYEQRRYDAYLPSCFGGEQRRRNVGGCVGSLKPRANEWAAQSRAFLERANEDWYSLLSMLRTLASRYGAHPGE